MVQLAGKLITKVKFLFTYGRLISRGTYNCYGLQPGIYGISLYYIYFTNSIYMLQHKVKFRLNFLT